MLNDLPPTAPPESPPVERWPAPPEDQRRAAANGVLGDEQLHALLLFDRRIDAVRMNEAVRRLMSLVPVLGSRFVVQDGQGMWEQRRDLDTQNLWTVHVESGLLPPEARPGVARYVTTPKAAQSGLVLEARIFRSTTDLLCLKLQHSASDAAGLQKIIVHLAAIYRGLENPAAAPAPRPFPPPAAPRLRPDAAGAQPPSMAAQVALSGWDYAIQAGGAHSRPAYAVQKAPLIVVKNTRSLAKRTRASLEYILAAAYYQALVEVLEEPNRQARQMGLWCNLRGSFSGPEQALEIANVSSWVFPTIQAPAGASFQETLDAVRKAAAQERENQAWQQPTLDEIARPEPLTYAQITAQVEQQRAGDAAHPAFLPMLAHYGSLEPLLMGFGSARVIDAYLLGPELRAPRFLLTCSTFGETMTLAANFDADAIEEALVERLLSGVIANLAAV